MQCDGNGLTGAVYHAYVIGLSRVLVIATSPKPRVADFMIGKYRILIWRH